MLEWLGFFFVGWRYRCFSDDGLALWSYDRLLDDLRFGHRRNGTGDGSGLFRRGRRRWLLRLYGANETVTFGLTTDSVGLGFFDRRRVALHTDPELNAEIERLFVGEA